MRACRPAALLATLLLSACALHETPMPARIALLAPFEGRYREIGYNALYAARLVLAGRTDVELLPIDDGGSAASAAQRARALADDPQVIGAVVLGYAATNADTLANFADVPLIIAGWWGSVPAGETVFAMTHPQLNDLIDIPHQIELTAAAALDAPLVGGDLLALEGFAELRPRLDGITIMSSGRLPDAEFIARYRHSDPFAPQPNLIATQTYDSFNLLLPAIGTGALNTRGQVRERLLPAFEGGYWREAQIRTFRYNEIGQLIAIETSP